MYAGQLAEVINERESCFANVLVPMKVAMWLMVWLGFHGVVVWEGTFGQNELMVVFH